MKERFEIAALEVFLGLRGAMFRGSRHRCPVCGIGVSRFMMGGGSFRARQRGYCPRCNSKARHRRVWLHCTTETEWFARPTRLLHVAPKYCTSRRLRRIATIDYHAVDVVRRPHVDTLASLTSLPFASDSFDALLCVHVLEHIDDDIAAMSEMFRVLAPGGEAVINVPTNMDAETFEDPTIRTEQDRREAFGEADHRRVYGKDLPDRLGKVGFEVTTFLADSIPPGTIERYGLTTDEHVFHCVKPGARR
jgi:SAM-dependent methyltransferase